MAAARWVSAAPVLAAASRHAAIRLHTSFLFGCLHLFCAPGGVGPSWRAGQPIQCPSDQVQPLWKPPGHGGTRAQRAEHAPHQIHSPSWAGVLAFCCLPSPCRRCLCGCMRRCGRGLLLHQAAAAQRCKKPLGRALWPRATACGFDPDWGWGVVFAGASIFGRRGRGGALQQTCHLRYMRCMLGASSNNPEFQSRARATGSAQFPPQHQTTLENSPPPP